MIQRVIRRLRRDPAAAITWPDEATMREYAAMVRRREPCVHNVIGFVDGVSLSVQCCSERLQQNAMYDGYIKDTMINNVLAFAPNGKIIYAALNFPGSWPDSQLAAALQQQVVNTIGDYALCVDSGFPMRGDMQDRFVGPLSRRGKSGFADPELKSLIIRRHRAYTSLRQAAEWGMRGLQGTFARLKSRLTSDTRKRHDLLYGIVLISNFRTEYVGLNQISTVFNKHYDQIVAVEEYDRIAQYFHWP
jgi:hypothetical protein